MMGVSGSRDLLHLMAARSNKKESRVSQDPLQRHASSDPTSFSWAYLLKGFIISEQYWQQRPILDTWPLGEIPCPKVAVAFNTLHRCVSARVEEDAQL